MAIDPKEEEKILTKVILTLFSKQKKFLKGIVRCEEKITFYVLPEHVERLIQKVRRFMTHSQIDHPKLLIFLNPISGADSRSKLQRGL